MRRQSCRRFRNERKTMQLLDVPFLLNWILQNSIRKVEIVWNVWCIRLCTCQWCIYENTNYLGITTFYRFFLCFSTRTHTPLFPYSAFSTQPISENIVLTGFRRYVRSDLCSEHNCFSCREPKIVGIYLTAAPNVSFFGYFEWGSTVPWLI